MCPLLDNGGSQVFILPWRQLDIKITFGGKPFFLFVILLEVPHIPNWIKYCGVSRSHLQQHLQMPWHQLCDWNIKSNFKYLYSPLPRSKAAHGKWWLLIKSARLLLHERKSHLKAAHPWSLPGCARLCVGAVNDGFLVQPWVTGVNLFIPLCCWALLRLTISRKRGLCSVFITTVPMSDERSGNWCRLCRLSGRQSIKSPNLSFKITIKITRTLTNFYFLFSTVKYLQKHLKSSNVILILLFNGELNKWRLLDKES